MKALSYAQVKKADRETPNVDGLEQSQSWIVKSQVKELWDMANKDGALNAYDKHYMRRIIRALVFQLTE